MSQAEAQENPSAGGKSSRWKRLAVWGVVLLVMALILRYVFMPVRVDGISMEPTYHDGNLNLINLLAYARHAPERGDVVATRFAGRRVLLLKRVIALPGEHFFITNGVVVVNGKPLDEPYAQISDSWQAPAQQLGPEEYLIIGDNRSMDQREHTHGAVLRRRIMGKAVF